VILAREGIRVTAHTKAIGRIEVDHEVGFEEAKANVESNPVRCATAREAALMEKEVTDARSAGDSVGGIVEFIGEGLPIGLGDPFFDSVESLVAHLCFAIPAVKGLEFGAGFGFTKMHGSQANDPYLVEGGHVRTRTNNHGGVLGGLTTGMPVRFRVAFKPTSSIPIEQDTVDLDTMQPAKLKVAGRHDPCIVPRAVPVVEACGAFVLADLLLREKGRGALGK
jgi:chorismate synthase